MAYEQFVTRDTRDIKSTFYLRKFMETTYHVCINTCIYIIYCKGLFENFYLKVNIRFTIHKS